jgi:multicomponent Na+:H+ antiporter subunit D
MLENQYILLLIPGLSFISAIFNSMFGLMIRKKKQQFIYDGITTIILLIKLGLAIFLVWELQDKKSITTEFAMGLYIDGISGWFLLSAEVIFVLTMLYSVYYIQANQHSIYFTLTHFLMLGIELSYLTNNYFLLFVYWEIMVLSGYVLVTFERTNEAIEAGFKYLIISSFGSLLMLSGIAFLTGVSYNLQFDNLAGEDLWSTKMGRIGIALILSGLMVTAGAFLMNQWLPDAHPAAPAPISAILSGVVVKVGIYAIYRTIRILNFEKIPLNLEKLFLVIAIITMTEANILVIAQFRREDSQDLKRILAYSSIVHLGYLLLIVVNYSDTARVALIYHTISHSLAKGMLFLISGYLLKKYKTRDLRDLQGVGKTNFLLGFGIMVGLFSLGGLPLTAGFISKLLILISVYEGKEFGYQGTELFFLIILILAVINTLFAFSGYLWMIKIMILNKKSTSIDETVKMDKLVQITLSVFIVLILVLGIFPNYFIDLIVDTF